MDTIATKWQARYVRVLDPLSRAFLVTASIALTFIALYLLIALIGQNLKFEVPDQLLLIAEAMILVVFLPQASVVSNGEHIQVDVLVKRLSPIAQARVEIASHLFGVLFYTLLTIAGWLALAWAAGTGAYHMGLLAVPEWITRLAFVLGAGLALLRSASSAHIAYLTAKALP